MLKTKLFLSKNFTPIILVGLIFTSCFSENKRPEKNTLQFGAKEPPIINISPEFAGFKSIFADVAEKVIPTVVSITSTHIDTVFIRSNPFDFFGFGFPFGEPPRPQQQQRPQARERRQSGAGSGVIVSSDGYILTNSHVVSGASEIRIKLHDDREFPAEIIGFDTLSDVAVVRITQEVKDLPVAYLGDSDKLRPGDWVMAVGNPFGLSSTVTTGIVSALGRHTDSHQYQNFIQTDAAINPGNSGGALVNINGELIGINTMIFTRSGGHMGIGFAIPISMARNIMEQLIYSGEVRRGWLGVSIANLDQNMMEALGLKERGVLINEVFENEPAQRAGMKSGDVVISINGRRTPTPNDLRNIVATLIAGERYSVEVIRDGKKRTLTVIPSVRGESKEVAATDEKPEENSQLGMTLRNTERGVVSVERVQPGTTAERSGIRAGDVILAIKTASDRPFIEIKSTRDFDKEMRQLKGESIVLRLERNGQRFFVSLRLDR